MAIKVSGTTVINDSRNLENITSINGTAVTNFITTASGTLSDLSNVSAASPSSGEFLKWSGSAWVNASIPSINVLDDVGNVTITSNSSGEILKWSGSAWVNNTLAEAGIQAYDANLVSDANYVATDENFTTADHAKLDAIEANATADQTAAEILTAVKTVDGAASGLDADLLDGQHGAYYTGYTDTAVANLVSSAPSTLDTLNELAAALGDDANFSTTVTNSIATKLPLAGGTMTGNIVMASSQTVDGRDLSVDGTKLDTVETNADVTDVANVTTALNSISIDALSDVNTTTSAPSDAQVLTWVNSNSRWEAADASGGLDTQTATLTTASETAIATFAKADFNGLKVFISVVQGTARHVTELLVTHDGTTAISTEYGTIFTGSSLATFDVDISGANIRILATGASATSKVYLVTYTAI